MSTIILTASTIRRHALHRDTRVRLSNLSAAIPSQRHCLARLAHHWLAGTPSGRSAFILAL